ncbi:MAG: hypothetical protein ACK5PB_03945 [Pirellula sp.]|jgi:hypothetical protein
MMDRSTPVRSGLSLLEVMIATGILAGSAIVLSSIIGTGARFGNRAESRVTAMVQAHSVLDETLARIAAGNVPEEFSGEIPGATPRTFEVAIRDLPTQELPNVAATRNMRSEGANRSETTNDRSSLVQIDVWLFDSGRQNERQSSKPIVHLTQITRRGPVP